MNIKCPSCGEELEFDGELPSGQYVSCPLCNHTFVYDEEPVGDTPSLGASNASQGDLDEGDKLVEESVKTVDEMLKNDTDESKEKETAAEKKPLRGKIYEDSVSLYDDEARIAFDYFRKAAERIVAEEDAVTAKKVKAEADIVEAKKEVDVANAAHKQALDDAKKAKLWFIGFFLVIPIFIAISKILKAKKCRLAAESQQKAAIEKVSAAEKILAGIKADFDNIKRDYTISKLGVAYVPIATEVPFEDKSFILDDTKKTANSTFDLYQVKAQDEFIGTLTSIKDREAAVPVAETGIAPEAIPAKELVPSFDSVWMNDYLGGMDRDLRAMAYFLHDLKKTSVTLPVIAPHGEYAKFLDEYCTSDTGDMPVLNVFDNSSYSEDLKKFEEINEMKKKMTFSNESLDDVLQNFISEIAENVQYVGRAKIASISKVLSACGETLLNSFKASYNHYSPEVAKEEIERLQQEDFSFRSNDTTGVKPFMLSSGSRVRYDAVSSNWVADDGARVSAPLGIHQIQEEIISPLVQNLLRETRIERLKIYNNIIDQKLNYVKEWQKEVDDFYGRGRAEGNDIINQIQVVLGEFATAYSQYEAFRQTEQAVAGGDESAPQNMKLAEGSSEKNVIAFKEQADRIDAQKDEFNRYVEDLQVDIERRANEFSYTEDYEASLRDRHSKDAVMSLKVIDKLDDRRKVLLAANPYIAENAKLPPEATVNGEELYGSLGKDLCATATTLVNAIDAELKDEVTVKEEENASEVDEKKPVDEGSSPVATQDSEVEEVISSSENIEETNATGKAEDASNVVNEVDESPEGEGERNAEEDSDADAPDLEDDEAEEVSNDTDEDIEEEVNDENLMDEDSDDEELNSDEDSDKED